LIDRGFSNGEESWHGQLLLYFLPALFVSPLHLLNF
jgi:hypothetical protein